MSDILQPVLSVGQWFSLALAVGYVAYALVKGSEQPLKIIIKVAVTLPLIYYSFHLARAMGPNGLFVVMIGALFVGIVWTPHIGNLVAGPLMGVFDGGNEPPEKKPLYSTAHAKRKRGEWQAAIDEVRGQLGRFPNDLEGTMLIAAIQAENLDDLSAASNTLDEFCHRPETTARQAASAWMALADWHLQINADVELAETVLRKIIARNPETEFALLAEQRLSHLVDARDTIVKRQNLDNITVPEGVKNLGLLDEPAIPLPAEENFEETTRAYIGHLHLNPNDLEVRQKLALIYARDFKRLDLAALELEQLISQRGCSPRQISGWLNLLATIQVEFGGEIETVRATLGRIPQLFPELSFAENARRRIELLNNELKGRKETTTVKLGVYEQNIGLKYGRGK